MTTAPAPIDESEDITIACTVSGSRAEVRVGGELDAYTSISLRRVLDDCLRPPMARVACNLADVTFIDSGALGLLVSARRRAEAAHIEFSVEDPSPTVRRLLDVTGMTDRLVAQPQAL